MHFPSDPLSGQGAGATVSGNSYPDIDTSSYYACVGPTTRLSVPNGVDTGTIQFIPTTNFPSAESTGLYTFQKVYGINSCIDGTSNTIAYSEGIVNPAQTGRMVKNVGVSNVPMDPSARILSAWTNPPRSRPPSSSASRCGKRARASTTRRGGTGPTAA